MENLIETIEKFLAYSDEKLEELAEENQKLREENHQSTKKRMKGGANEKTIRSNANTIFLDFSFCC